MKEYCKTKSRKRRQNELRKAKNVFKLFDRKSFFFTLYTWYKVYSVEKHESTQGMLIKSLLLSNV